MFDRHFAVWPENLPHHLTIPETSLCTNLDVSALRYPEKLAITDRWVCMQPLGAPVVPEL